MCLTVKNRWLFGGLRIALRDITVYKILLEDNTSPHFGFKYEPNALYKCKMRINNIARYKIISEGLHSYAMNASATRESYWAGVWSRRCKIVRMFIPTGSLYYRGMHGDIVSNRLHSGNLENPQ